MDDVRAPDVTRFLLRKLRTVGPSRAKLMVGALRSFFRFLRWRGDIAIDLASSVPKVADWRLSALPKSLQADEVERLIGSCRRGTVTGQRDYTPAVAGAARPPCGRGCRPDTRRHRLGGGRVGGAREGRSRGSAANPTGGGPGHGHLPASGTAPGLFHPPVLRPAEGTSAWLRQLRGGLHHRQAGTRARRHRLVAQGCPSASAFSGHRNAPQGWLPRRDWRDLAASLGGHDSHLREGRSDCSASLGAALAFGEVRHDPSVDGRG